MRDSSPEPDRSIYAVQLALRKLGLFFRAGWNNFAGRLRPARQSLPVAFRSAGNFRLRSVFLLPSVTILPPLCGGPLAWLFPGGCS